MFRSIKNKSKDAYKYKFTVTLDKTEVVGTEKWQPYKICVSLNRRKRKESTQARSWHPSMTDTCSGIVNWTSDDFIDVLITLFKEKPRNVRNGKMFEKKEWVLVLDNETQSGKRKAIATSRIDFSTLVTDIPSQKLVLKMKPLSKRLKSACVTVYTTCKYEGKPKPGDAMSSYAGSTTSENTMMLGNITDFDDSLSRTSTIESGTSKQFQQEMSQLTNQFEASMNSFGEDRPSSIASSNSWLIKKQSDFVNVEIFQKLFLNTFW